MTTQVTLTQARRLAGIEYAVGATVSVADGLAAELVSQGLASYVGGQPSGWINVPSIFRVRLTGTGTCVMDSRDRLGAITESVATFVASAATNQIEFPYAGDAAVEVRFRTTGTMQAEVI